MGSKLKSGLPKRTTTTAHEQQDHIGPANKKSKTLQDEPSSILLTDYDVAIEEREHTTDIDIDQIKTKDVQMDDMDQDEDVEDVDMRQSGGEYSDDESDVEDDEDRELRANSDLSNKKIAHTSDHVHKALTNPEVEAAFCEQYMASITMAFGDELNTLRETDSLDESHLELLIDSLNQTGHIYSGVEKALWVAGNAE